MGRAVVTQGDCASVDRVKRHPLQHYSRPQAPKGGVHHKLADLPAKNRSAVDVHLAWINRSHGRGNAALSVIDHPGPTRPRRIVLVTPLKMSRLLPRDVPLQELNKFLPIIAQGGCPDRYVHAAETSI